MVCWGERGDKKTEKREKKALKEKRGKLSAMKGGLQTKRCSRRIKPELNQPAALVAGAARSSSSSAHAGRNPIYSPPAERQRQNDV